MLVQAASELDRIVDHRLPAARQHSLPLSRHLVGAPGQRPRRGGPFARIRRAGGRSDRSGIRCGLRPIRPGYPASTAAIAVSYQPGSSAPHSSRAECMASWATPTSTVRIPSRAAVIGPMVEPHGRSVRHDERWVGTPASAQACRNAADRLGVGGVALVGVDLHDRAAVQATVVLGLVAVGVVGVGGVRHVGREAQRAGQRPRGTRRVRRRRRRRCARGPTRAAPSRPRLRWWSRPPRGRTGTRRAPPACPRGRSSSARSRGERGAQVVEPRRADEHAAEAGATRRRQVVDHQVPGEDVVGGDAEVLGDEAPGRRPGPRSPSRPQTGARCCCGSSFRPSVTTVAVEVDGQLRDAQQRAVDAHQARLTGPSSARTDTRPGQPEVAVEPRVHQRAAVDLDAELADAGRAAVGPGLDPQVRAVGVGADDPEAPRGAPPRWRQAISVPPRRTYQPPAPVGSGCVERRRLEAVGLEQPARRPGRRGTGRGRRR